MLRRPLGPFRSSCGCCCTVQYSVRGDYAANPNPNPTISFLSMNGCNTVHLAALCHSSASIYYSATSIGNHLMTQQRPLPGTRARRERAKRWIEIMYDASKETHTYGVHQPMYFVHTQLNLCGGTRRVSQSQYSSNRTLKMCEVHMFGVCIRNI